MAIKDWKKWVDNKFHVTYLNKNKESEYYNDTIDYWYKPKEMEILHNEKRVLLKTFKTKSQALKFAKAYMRKH